MRAEVIATNKMNATFYMPRNARKSLLEKIQNVNPDQYPGHFASGEAVWSLQTYLRLRSAGIDVNLSIGGEIKDGLALCHADRLREMLTKIPERRKVCVVCMRADRRQDLLESDYEVVQNKEQSSERKFFIHHWPQPGLIPRSVGRVDAIKTIDSKSRPIHDTGFISRDFFKDFLFRKNLEYIKNDLDFSGKSPYLFTHDDTWWNYAGTDLLLGIRGYSNGLYPSKPSSKLFNSWLAGVPAILGPEIAFRSLRKSRYDYIEVLSDAEIIPAIEYLIDNPREYRNYIEQGAVRAKSHTVAMRVSEWGVLLESIKQKWSTEYRGY